MGRKRDRPPEGQLPLPGMEFDDSSRIEVPDGPVPECWEDFTPGQLAFVEQLCMRCTELQLVGDVLGINMNEVFSTNPEASRMMRRWYALGLIRAREFFAERAKRDDQLMRVHYQEFLKRMVVE